MLNWLQFFICSYYRVYTLYTVLNYYRESLLILQSERSKSTSNVYIPRQFYKQRILTRYKEAVYEKMIEIKYSVRKTWLNMVLILWDINLWTIQYEERNDQILYVLIFHYYYHGGFVSLHTKSGFLSPARDKRI